MATYRITYAYKAGVIGPRETIDLALADIEVDEDLSASEKDEIEITSLPDGRLFGWFPRRLAFDVEAESKDSAVERFIFGVGLPENMDRRKLAVTAIARAEMPLTLVHRTKGESNAC